MLRALRVAAVTLCLSAADPCFAQDAAEPSPAQIREAAEAFDRGREAYQKDDFVGAAEQFERADSQAPSATALEYAIRARDRAAQLDRAATLAVLAQKRYPEEASLAKVVPGVLSRAATELFELTVQCSEVCELAVGGKIVHGKPETERRIYLPQGSHSVRAGFDGNRSQSQQVEAATGGKGQLTFEAPKLVAEAPVLAESPPAPAPAADFPLEERRRSGWSPIVFWVGAGLTAAATGVTVWSGLHTLSNPGKDRIRDECGAGETNCAAYQEGLSNQRRTNVLIGVSAGLGLSTILIGALATDWGAGNAVHASPGSNRPKQTARLEPWLVVENGALLGAKGRF